MSRPYHINANSVDRDLRDLKTGDNVIMAKKVAGTMKLQVPAGQANPSPPVGPALGQRGINIMEFCKAFNAKTEDLEPGAPCPTIITYYQDKQVQ